MAQNIYDDPEFFDGYAQLQRSIHGLDGAPEWPAVRAMLPNVAGAHVLDLGCGYGWFCRWAAEQGAAEVVGIDVSERMLARAAELTAGHAGRPTEVVAGRGAGIRYVRDDLDKFTPPTSSFDVVVSSLALHYVADLPRLVRAVRDCLRDGGAFVFNVEHPVRTATIRPGFVDDGEKAEDEDREGDGEEGETRHWPLDHYQMEGPRTLEWITAGVVKHHRTVSSYLTTLIATGFRIDHVEEWCPSAEQLDEQPTWRDELHRPSFLMVAASAVSP